MPSACFLCGSTTNKRVRSHIVPAAFFREIKRRGGALMSIPRNGNLKIQFSKDGPKDHRILCLKCEQATAPIDDYGTSVFLRNNFKPFRVYSKKQRIAGYADNLDGKQLKVFIIFTLLKASWSSESLYEDFTLPEQINKLFLHYLRSGQVDDTIVYCFLIRRHPTVKEVPGSPEVHNGMVDGMRHNFNQIGGHLFFCHFLEFTALTFVRDTPSNDPLPKHFIHDCGRVWLFRSQIINEKLDNVAFEFMRDRHNSEQASHAV